MQKRKFKIVIAEDNEYYNKALTKYVQTICSEKLYPSLDFQIKSYLSASDCIENLEPDLALLILDYYFINEERGRQLTGADVMKQVELCCKNCRVIIISSMEKKEIKEELIHSDVFAYIDKNLNSNNLIGNIILDVLYNETYIKSS